MKQKCIEADQHNNNIKLEYVWFHTAAKSNFLEVLIFHEEIITINYYLFFFLHKSINYVRIEYNRTLFLYYIHLKFGDHFLKQTD